MGKPTVSVQCVLMKKQKKARFDRENDVEYNRRTSGRTLHYYYLYTINREQKKMKGQYKNEQLHDVRKSEGDHHWAGNGGFRNEILICYKCLWKHLSRC